VGVRGFIAPVDPSSYSLTPGHSMTPIRPCDDLSTPWMVQLTLGVDINHFENHWTLQVGLNRNLNIHPKRKP